MSWVSNLARPYSVPDMGSTNIGVACLRRGLHYIGIDCDPAYVAIAEERLHAESEHSIAPTAGKPWQRQSNLFQNEETP